MLNRRENVTVHCHVVRGSRYLLADERNKQKLLDIVLSAQVNNGWNIYAFCLTDSDAYFVAETESEIQLQLDMDKIQQRFLTECTGNHWSPFPARMSRQGWQLSSMEELLLCCWDLHCIPVRLGYVSKLSDYWWSSYISYIGIYQWDMVDSERLLPYIAANPLTARRRLRQLHRENLSRYNI